MITKHTFYKYLKCPSWVAHEAREGHFSDGLKTRIQQDGLLFGVEAEIVTKRGPVEDVHSDDLEEAQEKTLSAMKLGVQTIYGGTLIHKHYVAQPDLLEKVQGRSAFGDYYYVAVDIKRSRRIKPEYKLQGCFYADVLLVIQGVKPVDGYVMHADGSIDSYRLEEAEVEYRLTRHNIERILDGEETPHFLTSDCKQSPWFHVCKEDTVKCDDLSLINRIWRSEIDSLRQAGIEKFSDLVAISAKELKEKVTGITADRLEYLHLQATALHEYKTIRVGGLELEPKGREFYVDIESDPLRDCDYLFGVLVVEDGKVLEYKKFLATKPADEAVAWSDFLDFIDSDSAAPIIHWGQAERFTFSTLAKKYKTEEGRLESLLSRSIDLLEKIRTAIIFPLSFYSLKDIAQYLGFNWRHSDASGLNSVLWYEDWLTTGNKLALEDIINYNEDDVRATWFVLNWARTNK